MIRFSARREEIPGDLPPLEWYMLVLEYERQADLLPPLHFYSPEFEYLTPVALARVRAKVAVWREITGEYPTDLSMWGEIRKARKRGYLPHLTRARVATIDDQDILRCGFCQSRYSLPHPERCNACDTEVIYG